MQAIQSITERIFVLKEKTVRAVNNLDFYVHTSNSYLDKKTLMLEDFNKFKMSVIMYFAVNNEGYYFFV